MAAVADKVAAAKRIKGGEEDTEMWQRLENDHPVIYEVIQWSVLGLSLAALIISAANLL